MQVVLHLFAIEVPSLTTIMMKDYSLNCTVQETQDNNYTKLRISLFVARAVGYLYRRGQMAPVSDIKLIFASGLG